MSMVVDFDRWRALVRERPLISIDTETSDSDAATCGVCEFAALCYDAASIEAAIAASNLETGLVVLPVPTWAYPVRLNPQVPIMPGATRVHGITDADVAECPTIDSLAVQFGQLAATTNVVGFNLLRFDLPVLQRVAGYTPASGTVLDVMGLWQQVKTHSDLTAWVGTPGTTATYGLDIVRLGIHSFNDKNSSAYAAVFGRKLEGAHGAAADAQATAELMFALLLLFPTLPMNFGELAALAESMLCFVQVSELGPVFKRGKHAGTLVSHINDTDDSYIGWMMRAADIDEQSKATVVALLGEARVGQILAKAENRQSRGRKPKA